MSDLADLTAFPDLAWQRLADGVITPGSAARHPSFATVSPDGVPEARTVVMRAADRPRSRIEVPTDLASAKCRSLTAPAQAELLVWDPHPRLHIRLATRVDRLSADVIATHWAKGPTIMRVGQGADPPPGRRYRPRLMSSRTRMRPDLPSCNVRSSGSTVWNWARATAVPP